MFFLLIKTLLTAKLLESDINWQYCGRGRRAGHDMASTSLPTGKKERVRKQTVLKLGTYAPGDPQRTHIYST